MKTIEFPDVQPSYSSAEPCLQCVATVGGDPASFAVTAEALEDHFGARSYQAEDLLAAFHEHREEILCVARNMLELSDSHNVMLHSGHFRFAL
ncbi:DUF1488 domain-containing protein [Cupriavidus respiraculi]|uniref:DUF1488 domain-containing protein n=1 Tax=Cupriavidus respiraculi TaxID=195930 RepID=A0ABM8WGV1_9BURK|nr:DUF1488 domain-containing protein [Cupriavidus respiraculi]MBY4947899.1 DUF1488 domain-containing protein [Cupriavidus respiraculi]CAG9166594.1 hypothetical protein LMG21510_00447 [Cupriavidus respiraculi]